MSVVSIIALCGAVLGSLLTLALAYASDRNSYANRVLAVFLGCSALYLLALVPMHNQWQIKSEWSRTLFLTIFLNGPLLYAYVKAMCDPQFRIKLRHSVHLLPIPLIIFSIIFFQHQGKDYFQMAAQKSWPPSTPTLIGLFFYMQLISYLMAGLFSLNKHAKNIQQQFSYQEGVNLRWLRILLSLCMAIAIMGFAIALARIFTDFGFWPRAIFSMSLMLSVYYLIAFMAIAQPAIFNDRSETQPDQDRFAVHGDQTKDIPLNDVLSQDHAAEQAQVELLAEQTEAAPSSQPLSQTENPTKEPASPAYETSSLTSEKAAAYWLQLQDAMQQHKPHLNNELRIKDLAEMMTLPSNHLSQVINQCAKQNFFEFINDYRVTAAKTLLIENRDGPLNISLIALEAGFNSQSAFYKQFKQRVGLTPKQFQKQLS
ncbi:MAG: helix-turn-helix transcriptional regulator [Pseudomonadales bacterium]|nr:helix-turn-helix transcriptional regulator [Pseudomonadales bacterium]